MLTSTQPRATILLLSKHNSLAHTTEHLRYRYLFIINLNFFTTMRKFFLFSLVIFVLPMISSCERDFEQNLSMQQITPSNTRSVNLLSFNSEEEMKAQAESLRLMDEESRVQWYNDHNFESQHTAMYRIIEEFEQAQSYEEALQMKEVYSQYFLFNNDPSEEELFNPYLPTSKSEYAFVCNIEGNVIINGEVVNYNTISNVCETAEYKLTHRDTRIVEEQLNYLYSNRGGTCCDEL